MTSACHRPSSWAGASLMLASILIAASCTTSPLDTGPRTVQPGAPGTAGRVLQPEAVGSIEEPTYTDADVRFMRGMIPHHAQALVMAALIPDRAASEDLRRLGLRVEISQADEIALMERWLTARGESTAPLTGRMSGMLTADQLSELERARGPEFDHLWLELMILHHEGAIAMVRSLLGTVGGGQESEIFQFASHVDADQQMEVQRMRKMLEGGR